MGSGEHRGLKFALLGTTALLVASGAVVYLRPFETARSVMKLGLRLSGVRERTVNVDGLPVRYLEAGPDDAPVLVLIHGLGGSAQDWSFVIPALAKEYRVLTPDLAGFGETPVPPEGMSFSALAHRLEEFLDVLGVEQAALSGNSLGGAVAIRQAARNSERLAHLFLLNSAGLLYDVPPALEPHDREQAGELVGMVSGASERTPGFVLDGMVRRAGDPARRAYLRSDETTDVKEDLPRITVPTTIIWGDLDRLIPPDHGERMNATMRNSELIMLDGVGHVPQLQVPREVVRILSERFR